MGQRALRLHSDAEGRQDARESTQSGVRRDVREQMDVIRHEDAGHDVEAPREASPEICTGTALTKGLRAGGGACNEMKELTGWHAPIVLELSGTSICADCLRRSVRVGWPP